MASITPFLWFDGDLAEPIAFSTSIFSDGSGVKVGAATRRRLAVRRPRDEARRGPTWDDDKASV